MSVPALRTEQKESIPRVVTCVAIPQLGPNAPQNPHTAKKLSGRLGSVAFLLPFFPLPFSSEKCFSLKVWGDLRDKRRKTLLLFLIMGFGFFLVS